MPKHTSTQWDLAHLRLTVFLPIPRLWLSSKALTGISQHSAISIGKHQRLRDCTQVRSLDKGSIPEHAWSRKCVLVVLSTTEALPRSCPTG